MNKHTKGPWEIHTAQNGRTIFQIGPCAPEEYAGSAWLDVSMENARLIAAAPDLLEALERLIKLRDDGLSNDYYLFKDAIDAAREVAKKARGEA